MIQASAAGSGGGATNEPLTVGRIVGLFGVAGWVKVFSYTRPREAILKYDPWLLRQADGWRSYGLATGRPQGRGIVASLEGIGDRDAAVALVGRDIAIERAQLPARARGEYYWAELEGLRVVTARGEELGRVSHLFETGANDVMVVVSGHAGRKQSLIPVTAEVVAGVDLDAGVITVDWDAPE